MVLRCGGQDVVFQGALMVVRQGAQRAQGAVDQGCG